MKSELNLFEKLTNEDEYVITIIVNLIACALLVIALYYVVYWCLKSWVLS